MVNLNKLTFTQMYTHHTVVLYIRDHIWWFALSHKTKGWSETSLIVLCPKSAFIAAKNTSELPAYLPACLMTSDKHYSVMAKATGLIVSL